MSGQSLVHGAGAVGMVGLVDAASSCCETVVQDALSLQLSRIGSGRHTPVLQQFSSGLQLRQLLSRGLLDRLQFQHKL